jgi:DNA-directed RNA polymerase specialized sigma subunit
VATFEKSKGPWASPQKLLDMDGGAEANAVDSERVELDTWMSSPTPETATPILKRLQPTIDGALRSYAGSKPEAYRVQANLIALDALKTYDPAKGTKLTTHVFNSLQKLHRVRSDRENFVHVPENKEMEWNRINKAKLEFEAENGREPNMRELADMSLLSVKRLEKLQKESQTNFKPESTFTSDDKEDVLIGQRRNPQEIWASYVYEELDPVDKKIYEWSTGYCGTKQIAKSEMAQRLRITPAAVSSRISKILKKLKEGESLNVS